MTLSALQTRNFTHDQFQHAVSVLHSLAASVARLATALWSAAMPSRQLVPTVPAARQKPTSCAPWLTMSKRVNPA